MKANVKRPLPYAVWRSRGYIEVELHPTIAQFYALYPEELTGYRPEIIVLAAGTGGGKTMIGSWWLQLEAFRRWQENGYNYEVMSAVAAPTIPVGVPARIMTKTILLDVLSIATEKRSDMIYGSNVFIYKHPMNGVVFNFYLTDTTILEGKQLDAIWVDEGDAEVVDPEAWNVIRDRCNIKQGRLLVTTTPYHKGALYKDIVLPGTRVHFVLEGLWDLLQDFKAERPDPKEWPFWIERLNMLRTDAKNWRKSIHNGKLPYLTIHFPSLMSPAFPAQKILEASMRWSDEQLKMRYFGEWEDQSGVIFPLSEGKNIINVFRQINHKPVAFLIGLDPAIGGTSGVIYVAEFGNALNDKYWVAFHEQYLRLPPMAVAEQVIKEIDRLGDSYTFWSRDVPIYLYFDPQTTKAGHEGLLELPRRIIAEVKAMGYNIHPYPADATRSITIDLIQRLMLEPRMPSVPLARLCVGEHLENYLDEAFHYTVESMSKRKDRVKDHLLDALRYAVATRYRQLESEAKAKQNRMPKVIKPYSQEWYNLLMKLQPSRRGKGVWL